MCAFLFLVIILGIDNTILLENHLAIQSRAKGATVREVQTSAAFVAKICDNTLLNAPIYVKWN